MQFEVKFAVPGYERTRFLLQFIEETVHCATRMNSGNLANCVSHASKSPKPLHVLPCWATTTVTLAELLKISMFLVSVGGEQNLKSLEDIPRLG
jgi:hypothetical protein